MHFQNIKNVLVQDVNTGQDRNIEYNFFNQIILSIFVTKCRDFYSCYFCINNFNVCKICFIFLNGTCAINLFCVRPAYFIFVITKAKSFAINNFVEERNNNLHARPIHHENENENDVNMVMYEKIFYFIYIFFLS